MRLAFKIEDPDPERLVFLKPRQGQLERMQRYLEGKLKLLEGRDALAKAEEELSEARGF